MPPPTSFKPLEYPRSRQLQSRARTRFDGVVRAPVQVSDRGMAGCHANTACGT